jgi:hypothetical protein
VPIGDVDVVLGEQHFDGVAQERGEMARHRRDQEHARLHLLDVLPEVQKRAEGGDEGCLFGDGDLFVADRDAVHLVARAVMRQPEARDHLQGGDRVPAHELAGKVLPRALQHVERRVGEEPQRRHHIVARLVD